MAEFVTLELPEPLMQQAKTIAALTQRRLEDVLIEWPDRAIDLNFLPNAIALFIHTAIEVYLLATIFQKKAL